MLRSRKVSRFLTVIVAGILSGSLSPVQAEEAPPSPDERARRIAARPANEGRVARMLFTMTNKSGASREREALMAHSEEDNLVKIAIFFSRPSMIAGTAFLSHDHKADADQNWLFLPATDRVRRIPSSDRGDYFMGTDLTYGDVKDDFKFPPEDWNFHACDPLPEPVAGRDCLAGEVKDESVAGETGYSRFRALVNTQADFPVDIEFWDEDGAPLKRIRVGDVQTVGGAWTATAFVVEHLQTGHRTDVRFEDMRYAPDLEPSVFDPASLSFGAPAIE